MTSRAACGEGVSADRGFPSDGITWQDLFPVKNFRRQNPTVSLEICGNRAVAKWRPRFVVYECRGNLRKIKISPESAEFREYVRLGIEGAMRWDSEVFPNPSPLVVRGIEGSFSVEVRDRGGRVYRRGHDVGGYDFSADSYLESNFAVFSGKRDMAVVWDAFRWSPARNLRVKMAVTQCNKQGFVRTAEHEFGHVLGLFDAYGYAKKPNPTDGSLHYGGHSRFGGLLPPTPIDGKRLHRNSVMVCDYSACHSDSSHQMFTRSAHDYEMILLAFCEGRLQLYRDCVLGRRSQAFEV